MCVFQGDIVDNIERNVSKSVDHIIVAKEQTKKAVRHQTKARKKVVIIIVVVLILVGLLALIIGLSVGLKHS